MNYIKKLRKEKGISCEKLSKEIGLSQSYLSRIENQERELSIDDAIKISKALNVSLLNLFVNPEVNNLDEARSSIDQIDKEISLLFNYRMNVVKKIDMIKKENNIPIENLNREKEVVDKNRKYIDSEFLSYHEKLITYLINLSKSYQKKA